MDNATFKQQNRQHTQNTKSALSEGFLDNIGSDKSYSNGEIMFDGLERLMLEYGELFIRGFRDELVGANAEASGFLEGSMRYEYTKRGSNYETSIFMSDYAKFTDEGVQGLDPAKNINRTSPFKFKFAHPSASHVAALERWIKEKNVTALITAPKGIVSKTLTTKNLAEAIGYATKQRGLKATFFKKNTVERLINKFKEDVAKVVSSDFKVNINF